MKKLLLFPSGLILMVLLISIPSYSGTVAINPPVSTVFTGQTFFVDVNATLSSSDPDLYGFQFDIGFDPTILRAIGVTEGSFLTGGGTTFWIDPSIDNVGGNISCIADTLLGSIAGATGSGVLARLEFQALAAGASPLNILNGQFSNSLLSPVNMTYQGGSVDVQTPVPEPSLLVLLPCGLIVVVGMAWRMR
jgi:hypothetical protein